MFRKRLRHILFFYILVSEHMDVISELKSTEYILSER